MESDSDTFRISNQLQAMCLFWDHAMRSEIKYQHFELEISELSPAKSLIITNMRETNLLETNWK